MGLESRLETLETRAHQHEMQCLLLTQLAIRQSGIIGLLMLGEHVPLRALAECVALTQRLTKIGCVIPPHSPEPDGGVQPSEMN